MTEDRREMGVGGREKERMNKHLACAIMEVNKSQEVQSASWRPKRAGGSVLVRKPAGSRHRET